VNHCGFTCEKTQDVQHFSKKFSKKYMIFEKFSKKYMIFEKFSKKYMVFEKCSKKYMSEISMYATMTSPTNLVWLFGTAGMMEVVPVHA